MDHLVRFGVFWVVTENCNYCLLEYV